MAVQAQLYAENLGFPMRSPQDLLMDNGFCFNLQQQNMQYNQSQNQGFCFDSSILRPQSSGSNSYRSMSFSPSLASEFKKQRLDIDELISLQNERLRLALQEQRKQQLAFLLKECESRAQIILRQKDEEIAKAVNRTIELENFLEKMEAENQAWQRAANENEALIMSLNNTIEQLRETARQSGIGVDNAESCCDIMPERKPDETGATIWENEQENREEYITRKMICKTCNSRSSCVLLLPCRHLCSCKDCEAYIDSCPVCKMEKKGSIEALI